MGEKSVALMTVVAVSAVVGLAGLGYLWVFWDGLGNDYYLNPSMGADSGLQRIQLSPVACNGPGEVRIICPLEDNILCETIWGECFQ